jgi:GAF domain-containing protein
MSNEIATSERVKLWLSQAKNIHPEVCDWIGIYFKESYLTDQPSNDLVLGPFLGEPTEHTRIPISRGLCGRAVREEKVINVGDVRADSEHIACSLKTRSELVIPLKDQKGQIVAELDIDCNKLSAFTPMIENKFKTYCESFQDLL